MDALTITPFRAAAVLFVLGVSLGIAILFMTRDAPSTRIDLALEGSADRMIWLCTQPSTLDEANARAKAAHGELAVRSAPLAEQAVKAMRQATRKAEAEGLSRHEIAAKVDAAQNQNMAEFDSLFAEIDAEFGCTPFEIVKP